ncbi:MAG: TonB family protein [Azospirillaceae bacterium]|nr:TonB family protein [Azospirillaceae bacterium]
MPYTSKQSSNSRLIGIVATVLIQAGLVYALVNGLANKVVEVVKGPVETKIIEEIKPDTPPPPPPPPPPHVDVQPPPFQPEVEVQIDNPPPPPIAVTTSTRPPTPTPPTQAVVAPAAPPAPPAVNVKLDTSTFQRYQPEYPQASIRLSEEGRVEFSAYCDADGRITEAKILKTSGSERLDNAVLKQAAAGRWKCTSAQQDGKAVPAWGNFAYRFQLKDAR